jgi:hypothetical protein
MGREATCACNWNGAAATVKALLEPPHLILRGEIRRKIPYTQIQKILVDSDKLRFTIDGEPVALQLGNAMAAKWAKWLLAAPPSLAKKLGITAQSNVRLIGAVDDDALRTAVSEAKSVTTVNGDLIIARVDTPRDLASALKKCATQLSRGVPIWFVYRKGPGHPLNVHDVRSAGLAAGIVDTKVAAVSKDFTALRFVKRRS